MKRVRVDSLIGKDVRGVRAITTHPHHRYLYPKGVPVRTLIEAKYKRENGRKWLYLYWEKDNTINDCGYSGWREDHREVPRIDIVEGES